MRFSHFRAFLVILFLFSFFQIYSGSPAYAQTPTPTNNSSVKMTIKAGFDGYFKEGTWLPIQVTLENAANSNEPINGRIEASLDGFTPDGILYYREVNLSPPYRKTYWLYILGAHSARNLQVRLVDDSGAKLAEATKDLSPLNDSGFLIGVVSDDSTALNYINSLDMAQPPRNYSAFLYVYYNTINTPLANRTRAWIAHLSPNDLPSNPAGLNGLDALVVGDLSTTQLGSGGSDSTALRNSIGGWLANGKALLVAGDSGLRKAAFLQPLLPVTLNGGPKTVSGSQSLLDFVARGKQTTLPPGSTAPDLLVSDVKLDDKAAGASALIPPATTNEPLLLAARGYGLGTSWYFAGELQNLRGWNQAEAFWQTIFKDYLPRLDYATTARLTQIGNDWSYRITPNNGIKERFDTLSLIIFLSIYLVIIGVVVYFVLKRYDKREWGWWVVPVLGVLFTIIAYVINSGGLEQDMVISRTAVIMLGQGNDGVMQGSFTGLTTLYSNKRNEFDLKVADETLFSTSFGDSDTNLSGANSSSGSTGIKQGSSAGYNSMFLGLQQRRSFGFESEAERYFNGGIVAEAKLNNSKLEGTLENTTNRDWEDVMVFVPGGTVQKVGTIKAKEKKAIPALPGVPGANLVETLVNASSAQLMNATITNGINYPIGLTKLRKVDGKLVQDPDYHRAVVLESLFGMNGEGLAADNNRFYLIGWSKNAPLPFQIESKTMSNFELALLFEGLAVKV
ncbi:MAG: hypothetical protein HXX08_03225 [Chloroflexi bacterium]|uniref:Uncharacterized protein n=1 Tax=Candidatus Chlorohelix allophototropha TaxID=3003348 RepID=A0A8T7LVH4_9CHLR|nr:hypothetical protein [Chloroflexota bacterium]WJW66749.1 hypothetical protein OZ401_002564 [Chloroflexota bacterium L227-S17]